jgi:hypothetical protein
MLLTHNKLNVAIQKSETSFATVPIRSITNNVHNIKVFGTVMHAAKPKRSIILSKFTNAQADKKSKTERTYFRMLFLR